MPDNLLGKQGKLSRIRPENYHNQCQPRVVLDAIVSAVCRDDARPTLTLIVCWWIITRPRDRSWCDRRNPSSSATSADIFRRYVCLVFYLSLFINRCIWDKSGKSSMVGINNNLREVTGWVIGRFLVFVFFWEKSQIFWHFDSAIIEGFNDDGTSRKILLSAFARSQELDMYLYGVRVYRSWVVPQITVRKF